MATKRMSRIVRDAKGHDTKRIEQEMHKAAEKGEHAEVWRLVRARSERRLGPKIRSAGARHSLDTQQWGS